MISREKALQIFREAKDEQVTWFGENETCWLARYENTGAAVCSKMNKQTGEIKTMWHDEWFDEVDAGHIKELKLFD